MHSSSNSLRALLYVHVFDTVHSRVFLRIMFDSKSGGLIRIAEMHPLAKAGCLYYTNDACCAETD